MAEECPELEERRPRAVEEWREVQSGRAKKGKKEGEKGKRMSSKLSFVTMFTNSLSL